MIAYLTVKFQKTRIINVFEQLRLLRIHKFNENIFCLKVLYGKKYSLKTKLCIL